MLEKCIHRNAGMDTHTDSLPFLNPHSPIPFSKLWVCGMNESAASPIGSLCRHSSHWERGRVQVALWRSGGRAIFPTNGAGVNLYHTRKRGTWPYFKLYHTISFRNCRSKYKKQIINLLEGNIWLNLHYTRVGIDFFKKDFIYLFLERRRRREGEKHHCVVASHMPHTGDPALNPGMCPDWESNLWPFGSQAGTQSTEPHQAGQIFLNRHKKY